MDNLLRFLEKFDQYSFFTPWAAEEEQKNQQFQQLLEEEFAVDPEKREGSSAPFSFFSRQFNYFEFEELREEELGRSHHNQGGDKCMTTATPPPPATMRPAAVKKTSEFDRKSSVE